MGNLLCDPVGWEMEEMKWVL